MFDPALFFPAFQAHGLLASASFMLAGGQQVADVPVGYWRPGESDLDGVVFSDYEIEFETSRVTGLRTGNGVQVSQRGETRDFTVNESPKARGDGFFTRVKLVPA